MLITHARSQTPSLTCTMYTVDKKHSIATLFYFLLFVTPSLQKTCPLGLGNGTCDSGAKCALFDGNSKTCSAWSNYLCGSKQYRELSTCLCIDCPSGSGASCDKDNECCSLSDCGPVDATAASKPRPRGLSPAPRRAAQLASGILLAVTLAVYHVTARATP